MKEKNRQEFLLEYVDDVGLHDNHTMIIFKDAEGQLYVWYVYVTPNMSKVPAFFSKCNCVKGEKIKCRADIKGTDSTGKVHLKNLRVIK